MCVKNLIYGNMVEDEGAIALANSLANISVISLAVTRLVPKVQKHWQDVL